MTILGPPYSSVIDLAKATHLPPALLRCFDVKAAHPRCIATQQLEQTYGVAQDNVQSVVSVTDRATRDQTWWNTARLSKPQTFKSKSGSLSAADVDSTGVPSPRHCRLPAILACQPLPLRPFLTHSHLTSTRCFDLLRWRGGSLRFLPLASDDCQRCVWQN